VPERSRGKLFKSADIAELVRMEPALMRAKPRCGHGVALSISKKAKLPFVERTAQECAELPALPSTLIRFADFCLLVLNRIGRGLTIVPATIALAAALPAFGHAGRGLDTSALMNPTTCELCRLAWSLHYSQPGTQNESTDQKILTAADRTSDSKNILIPRVFDSVSPA
jgi:hypothetical protein